MNKSIALLLGAGFSAPKGYPVGNELNKKIRLIKPRKDKGHSSISITPNGNLYCNEGKPVPSPGWDEPYKLCLDLIEHYNKKYGPFDYEKFYDYLLKDVMTDKKAKNIAKSYITPSYDYSNLIHRIRENIYNQIVSLLIKDSNNENRYDKDNTASLSSTYPGYTGFLKYLSTIDKEYRVHIHTLNHDLLFESFNNTRFFGNEKICDGFNLINSKYYADVANNTRYRCKLERYSGKYDTRFRLYKLHGSLNYYRYYQKKKCTNFYLPAVYVKHIYGLEDRIYKECRNVRGILDFVPSDVDFHADFLTGTTAKIMRYKEPLLYKKLFKKFVNNLKVAEKLIIIGYGAKDCKINELIETNFDYTNKPIFVVNPTIQDESQLDDFYKKLQAKLISTKLENISAKDFNK
ncbi:MAG: hypothetical protein LBU22_03675 [Dysgonamonadaceae bacterium]|jgi:hypothetical protein|nr:hypothetical protein [Dysgonamonadaceae bacterium]